MTYEKRLSEIRAKHEARRHLAAATLVSDDVDYLLAMLDAATKRAEVAEITLAALDVRVAKSADGTVPTASEMYVCDRLFVSADMLDAAATRAENAEAEPTREQFAAWGAAHPARHLMWGLTDEQIGRNMYAYGEVDDDEWLEVEP